MRADTTRFLNDRLDWNLLRTYLAIMQERSLSRAAARLYVTQPAVSQALKRLEDALGRKLIERRGAQFVPTQAGEEVYRIASDIYGNISRLETELDERTADITGSIRLLTVSRIESRVYDEFLAEFHVAYPRIDLQIEVMRSSDIISSVLQKTATAGLSLCRTPVDKLEMRCFLRQRYAIFCGRHHRLFGLSQLTMEDLLAENFVSFTSDQIGDSLSPLTVFRDQRGFTGRIVASSPSLDEVRRLIFAGYGIGCLPEHAVKDDLARQRLWQLPPEEGLADVDIHLLWHRDRKMNAAEEAFFGAMERCMQRYALAERL
ncbi:MULTISPECIES: LysR family transcriptional regulator [Paraburkholderia]|jgi:DNA-binding transcriptional LysR family regulator|uniref:LysR family transcriptional regulator n=2 Tax=Burkholderiales TaxID=80840 RepID=A0A1A5X432_9BURK|nr:MULTISPECIES: LysR family transcriptional regulator [Paraburkholderia]MBB2977605.1 DNA-binding transcriptional LysR family regulator [Paraburkholderia tropica]MBB3000935.1 DNA-binding transcriptional LysR family regulator [Paraburkholderia tropica]MBB6319224.1 DNA-binding transcriptional LysR family regulator [Paraburkholderia tropica]MBN3809532.1 LysR family transcriptional regulator [Paraburkholderia sp. Ac-20347]MDE1141732.1 LysR family transcriptional regulator [Paraburkholderia tropica